MRLPAAFLVSLSLVAIMAITLFAMGRLPICPCGEVKLWHGEISGGENSQHLADWYTPSHVIHGIAFYFLGWLALRRSPIGVRLCAATLLEVAWEILENTDLAIDRYRTATIAVDYFGDSIVNSTADVAAMMAGFWIASRLPVAASIALVLVLEAAAMYFIRDGLALNILMFLWPVDAVFEWQSAL